ncbi:MAG TPA: hypothetical protein VMU04_04500 [Candidatus Acidoferrum sp.]|nr:hypothetical protein [Candidatus Acidoferrum sp.]
MMGLARCRESGRIERFVWRWLGSLVAVLGLALSAGCSSPGQPESDPLAWVEIHGQPHEKVADVAAEVFHDNGYTVTRKGWEHLIFEKPGSKMNNIAYRNWAEGPVWVRVKATVVDVKPGTCRLECEAFVVRSRNEPTEEEIRVNSLHRKKYQQMLDEVAKRLRTQPGGTS